MRTGRRAGDADAVRARRIVRRDARADSYPDARAVRYTNPNRDADVRADSYAVAQPDGYAHVDRYARADRYANADAYPNAAADRDANADGNPDARANRHAHAYPNANHHANADSKISPAAKLLIRSLKAMSEVESYRYSMNIDVTTESDDVITNLPIEAEGAYQAPDSYSAVLEVSFGFFGKIEVAVIAIGGALYIRDPNFGEWSRGGIGEDLSYFDPEFIAFLANPAGSIDADSVSRLRNLRISGTGEVDGAETRIVSFELPNDGGDDLYPKLGEVEVDVEIGVADSLMRRVDAVGELARRKGADSPGQAIPANPRALPEGVAAAPEPRVFFRSSAALSAFNAVSEPIKPPAVSR